MTNAKIIAEGKVAYGFIHFYHHSLMSFLLYEIIKIFFIASVYVSMPTTTSRLICPFIHSSYLIIRHSQTTRLKIEPKVNKCL